MKEILQDLKHYKPLSGYSGATILLATKDNTNWFVRKIAKSPSDSDRLKLQIEKQEKFKDFGIFKTPKVLSTNKVNDLFYADLEFINGPDGAKYLQLANFQQTKNFAHSLLDYFFYISTIKVPYINNQKALVDKVINIHSKELISDRTSIKLINKISSLPFEFDAGYCHGDLTLENFLAGLDGNIYLLDFLNSDFSHPYQDYSKLFQDFSGSWFKRKNINIPKSILDYLKNTLYEWIIKQDDKYATVHNLLICYNFLRILPYTKSNEERAFVETRINYYVERL